MCDSLEITAALSLFFSVFLNCPFVPTSFFLPHHVSLLLLLFALSCILPCPSCHCYFHSVCCYLILYFVTPPHPVYSLLLVGRETSWNSSLSQREQVPLNSWLCCIRGNPVEFTDYNCALVPLGGGSVETAEISLARHGFLCWQKRLA